MTLRPHLPTITEVAHQFGVGRTRVFNLLKRNSIIGSQGLVRARYLQDGYFVHEERSRYNAGTNKEIGYYVVTVTEKGKSLIQDLLDDAGIETTNRVHAPRVQSAAQNAG